MKKVKKVILIALLMATYIKYEAQNLPCYTDTTQPSQSPPPPNCFSCNSLDDYTPKPTDSILYVRLNFHYLMISPSNKGVYKNATILEAQATVGLLNSGVFDSIFSQQLRVYPAPNYIKQSKIRFAFNSFSKVYDSAAYHSTGSANWAAISNYIGDPNAIDIVFKGDATPGLSYGVAQGILSKALKKTKDITDTSAYVWWGDIGLLAHELGHCLGLVHTNSSSYGCVNDYVVEGPGVWNVNGGPCNPALDSTRSNNIMGYNYGCRRYLSPRQLARCHYNLRNSFLFNTLTPSSQLIAKGVQTTADVDITSNQIITIEKFYKGNVTIKPNNTLTIKCKVTMPKNARIFVEKGAQLIIDGGTVTAIPGQLWGGVYVDGDPTKPQLVPNSANPGSVLDHGILRMINGGTISHAEYAVRNTLPYINSYGSGLGGVVFGLNSNFIDNLVDVDLYASIAVSPPIQSGSWFSNCNFKTTGPIGANQYPGYNVFLNNMIGVSFRGCNFSCYTFLTANGGYGAILALNSVFSVDKNGSTPCTFENLQKAIWVSNTNPLRTPAINNSVFIDNDYGTYFAGINNLSVQNNTFTNVYRAPVTDVYLNGCKNYKINNNVFAYNTGYIQAGTGIAAYNSASGAHQIYRNKFSNLDIAVNCMGNNGQPYALDDGLKMNCNKFNVNPNKYDVAMTHTFNIALPTVNKKQGDVNNITANANNLVRNIYAAVCGNQNKWYVAPGMNATINHGANTNSTTAVTQPSGASCKSGVVNVVNMGIGLDYAQHCPQYPSSVGGSASGYGSNSSQRLTNMNAYLNELKSDEQLNGTSHTYEKQATVSSKVNLFVSDSSMANPDSVISLFQSNQGSFEDADIQTVFAYMNKGDKTIALQKTNQLAQNRADWKALLLRYINLEDYTAGNYRNINQDDKDFFEVYANSTDMDGKILAQVVLKAANLRDFNEPHAYPDEDQGSRFINSSNGSGSSEDIKSNISVQVYPNPTNSGFHLNYLAEEVGSIRIELKDLLGKIIYTNFSNSNVVSQYISLKDLENGLYILNLVKEKTLIFSTKIVKVD